MKEFKYPDFSNSNLNISSTIAKYLGCENDKPTIKLLEDELNKGYKNIVFICYDGLGIHPINVNLERDALLRKNIKMELTSTFPSTTTNATTSLLSNKYPLEHGWFGWSLNFDNIGRNIDIFKNSDSASGEVIKIENAPISEQKHYFDYANTDYEINSVFPSYVFEENAKINHPFNPDHISDFFNNVNMVLNKPGKQFLYAYLGEPDTTMHEHGVTSWHAKRLINKINKKTEKIFKNTKDTLFIITADHGQVDVEGYVDLYGDKKLMDMLKIYPYLDARAVAFRVKDGMKEEFKNYFNSKYSEDFELHESKELIEKGVFGPKGDKGELLGDFIAIGTFTHKTALMTPKSHKFKGHHTSLTEEMMVPLIIFNN